MSDTEKMKTEAEFEDAIRAAKAAAWDEGHCAGDGDCSVMWDADKAGESVKYREIVTPNPYEVSK